MRERCGSKLKAVSYLFFGGGLICCSIVGGTAVHGCSSTDHILVWVQFEFLVQGFRTFYSKAIDYRFLRPDRPQNILKTKSFPDTISVPGDELILRIIYGKICCNDTLFGTLLLSNGFYFYY